MYIKTVLCLLSLSGPAFADLSTTVQNGAVLPYTSPLYRSIVELDMAGSKCSASFLSSTTLLTAGHCTNGQPASSVRVRLRDGVGAWEERSAKLVVTHPGYRLIRNVAGVQVANDFGVIKLQSPFSIPVRPLRIQDPSQVRGSFKVIVAGYGRYAKGSSTDNLRQGRMLAEVVRGPQFAGASGLALTAAGSASQATCPGDSGGPVLDDVTLPTKLLAVHSSSNGCLGDPNLRSYSQIPAAVNSWIAQYL